MEQVGFQATMNLLKTTGFFKGEREGGRGGGGGGAFYFNDTTHTLRTVVRLPGTSF
jgi:hypothetical protein